MPAKIGAVVTGGDFQGLGALRTLARKGIPVMLLDSDHCIGRYSKYTKKFLRSPRPADEEAYLNFLINLAKKENINGWVIFPNSDEAVYVLSKHKRTLEGFYRVPTPHWDVIQNIYIKENTYRIAEKNGIPIPKTHYPKSLDELDELDLEFPVIIKPSIRDHFYSKVKIKAYLISNKEELLKTYQKVSRVIDPAEILVQDFIPGGARQLYSFCPFFKDGQSLAAIMAVRKRQHPMDFGQATTFAETVEIPAMQEIAKRFLSLIGYYGIGEVEFMKDPRDGQFRLLEVNPRIWGWHTLAIAAGLDLPYLLYQDAIGDQIHIPPIKKHMKWVRLVTDVPTVLLEIAKGRMNMADYLRSMRGKKEFAVFSLNDPLPFLAELAMTPYLWFRRGF